jgi:nicotinate-nucleotide--dimethylbenzimidazole phosphoribosyltransferase
VLHAERWTDADPGPATRAAAASAAGTFDAPPANPGFAYAPIPRPDDDARAAARAHQALLTKPIGSLGRLEEIAVDYAAARGAFPQEFADPPALALFMADHGVAVEGVSAYGSQVTAAMAANVMAGGAAVSVLARRRGVELVAVDVGIAGDTSAAPIRPRVPLARARVRRGTGNLRTEPAMTRAEAVAAIDVGRRVARDLCGGRARIVGVGEIGIGNTTSAAAIVSILTGASPEEACGRGTGVDDAVLARKIGVVRDALRLHAPDPARPLDALAAVGGLEIAAVVGFLLEAAALRSPVVLDGVVTNAAALVAHAIEPGVAPYLLASHVSPEPGARIALGRLGLRPLLALEMRLGEGTGALLGMDLLGAALALQSEMSTFATAGVVREGAADR